MEKRRKEGGRLGGIKGEMEESRNEGVRGEEGK